MDNQASQQNRTVGILAICLIVMTLIAYLPIVQNGFVSGDDIYLTDNTSLRTAEGLWRIWFSAGTTPRYDPAVQTALWVEYRIWGLQPIGYHMVSLAVHAANCVLIWRLLFRLQVPGAFLAAALFALHPVHVESVAWIAERKSTLSALCYLVAASIYLRSALNPTFKLSASSFFWYFVSLLFFCGALLSDIATVTLPLALLLVIWWRAGGLRRHDVVALIPMFVVGASISVLVLRMRSEGVGSSVASENFSIVEWFLFSGRAVWFYAGQLFWPSSLAFVYPRWSIDATVWWQYLYPVALVLLVIVLWALRKRISSGPVVAVLYFVLTLTPMLGFADTGLVQGALVADSNQYLASIGPTALASATIYQLSFWLQGGRPMIAYALGGPALLALLVLTMSQCQNYKSNEILWMSAWSKNDRSPAVLLNLGGVHLEKDDFARAMSLFGDAQKANPESPEPLFHLATALRHQNRVDEAIEHYRQALARSSSHLAARLELAQLLALLDRSDEAADELQEVLRIEPRSAGAHLQLGDLQRKADNRTEATRHYESAVELDPGWDAAHASLGVVYEAAGKITLALKHYHQAIELNPKNETAYMRLAFLMTGSYQDLAIQYYQAAIEANPKNSAAHYELATLALRDNDADSALFHLLQTLRIQPDHLAAHVNAANILWEKNRLQEAIHHYEEALRIEPDSVTAHYNLALVLLRENSVEKASQHLREALRLEPGFSVAQEKLDQISKARPGGVAPSANGDTGARRENN